MKTYHSPRNGMPYTGNDPQLMDNFDIPAHEWDAARAELGPWASDAQVERRALQLLDDELRDNDRMAEDCDESFDEQMRDWL